MKLKTHKDYYTSKDVCELLGKATRTLYKMVKDGRLPEPSVDGNLRVWKKSELDRWIRQEKHLN